MNDDINYHNNPLHGVGLKQVVTELVDHYGFEILHAYLNINCFKTKPSIASSVKFLKKTDWAREKVEGFYLYQFKSLPRASDDQFQLPPRERVIPDGQVPAAPAELSLEDAERLREKREARAEAYEERRGRRSRQSVWADDKRKRHPAARPVTGGPRTAQPEGDSTGRPVDDDPWAKARARIRKRTD